LIIRSPSARDKAGFGFRSDGLEGVAAVRLGHTVLAQALREILSVRHRFDAFGVDGLHFFDQGEYSVQVAERAFRLGVADVRSGRDERRAGLVPG
jgi:hypothetical protein